MNNAKTDKELAFLQDLFIAPDWGERFAELIDEHVKLPTEGRALYVAAGTGGHAMALQERAGSKLSLLYRDQNAAQGKKVRLRVTFTLDDKNDKRKLNSTLNLDSGDFSLIGNESDKLADGATYIVAVSCRVPGPSPTP